jgi:Bacterial Ig-like domain (group 3)/Beta-propeller repeat
MKNLQSAKLRRKIRFRSARTYRHQTQVEALESRTMLSGTAAPLATYDQIPMSFEVNQGQTDAQVQYLAHGAGYTLFLTPEEAVLSLPSATAGTTQQSPGAVLRMQLVGADATPQLVGQDQLPGTSNYITGSNPSQWVTNVPNFARVEEPGVYPGVNLVYYGNQQQLEYDFTVAPGADASVIRLAFSGAESMALDAQGNLVLHTAAGDALEHAPVLYQEIGGARQAVAGHYVLEPDGQVGFAVGTYETSQPLVIDPTLVYSTFLGGDNNDQGNAIAVDQDGNVYITGYTTSDDFPETANPISADLGGQNVFVSKLNAAGTALVYSTYLGGDADSQANGIAVDSAGDAYITGFTDSDNFPTTAGGFQTESDSDGNNTAFVAKLNPTGSALVYSTYLGGSGYEQGNGIAVDSAGNAYITGSTASNNFPTTPGAFQPDQHNVNGGSNAFVSKLNAAGSALIYSTYLGGNGDDSNDQGNAIAVDAAGDAYVTGSFGSTDFPTTADAFQSERSACCEAFVTKFNAAGTALVYSTYLGGSNGESSGNGIAVDAAGDAYITGSTSMLDFPITTGAFQSVHGTGDGDNDAFVTKLNADGTALVYSTYLGGYGDDQGNGIAVDAAGDAFVTGSTSSPDFPTTSGAVQSAIAGEDDAFVAEVSADGTALKYSTYLGGDDSNGGDGASSGQAIAVDSAGNAYVTGSAGSGNFPIKNAFQSTFAGLDSNAFIAKLASGQGQVTLSADTTTLRSSPSSSTIGQMVTFTATVTPNAGSTGTPTGTVTFEEGATVLGTAPLGSDGTATCSTATLAVGSHSITAAYSGDATFATSSGTTVQAVNQAESATTLAASPNTATAGQTVTLTATVTPDARSTETPTGTVTFEEGTTALGTAPLNDGVATFAISTLAVGSHSIAAVYSGDADFATAIGVTTETVNAPTPSPATSIGPRLTGVQRFGFHAMPTTVVLTFDQPLDPGSAEDVWNYVILDPIGHRIRINRAVLDPTRLTVTLHPAQRISIHHPYQLIVNGAGPGAVSNMSDQPLDSLDAGQPGSSDHVVLTWRQLVLGDVSRAFRIRYGLVPKGPRAKIPSGVSSPKAALGNGLEHNRLRS